MASQPLRVLVLTAFGPDEASDGSGELGRWLDGYDEFAHEITVSGVPTPVWITDHGVGVTATGIGPARAGVSVAALLATDALDTDNTYLLTAGVAGISPHAGTVGSVVLADHIVNWDAKMRYDGGTTVEPWGFGPSQSYELNTILVTAARGAADGVDLRDSAAAREHRTKYDAPPATDPPRLETGTSVAGADFWYGHTRAAAVESLVSRYDAGTYATTECEGFATAVACDRFGALDRYLSIRAASNFDRPPVNADEAGEVDSEWRMQGPSCDNAYRVGRAVADTIANNWETWHDEPPAPKE
ncbi:phosphorylase family protein [Halococcus sediminicola]|uniref:phosphorylase family protein n=1 Tax=Halococcus sediminicola TaxID=1264579 RepID=UPI0009AEF208|nr:hypothetical protein [Halococcus sediminicola]